MTEVKDTVVTEPVETVVTTERPEADLALIAESKKYRERAQKAEATLAKQESERKAADEKALEDQGKFKELNANLTLERDALKVEADEYTAYKEGRKKELLEQLPEEDREDFADFSMAQLEKVVKKFKSETRPKVVDGSPGTFTITDQSKALVELTKKLNTAEIDYKTFVTEKAKIAKG